MVGDTVLGVVVRADLLQRSPLPICASRRWDCSSSCLRRFELEQPGAGTPSAFCLFWSWDFSSCIATTRPIGTMGQPHGRVGRVDALTPGPVERWAIDLQVVRVDLDLHVARLNVTATVAVEVWMRPWDSVTGTRCTRCVPPSHLDTEYAPSPLTAKVTSL